MATGGLGQLYVSLGLDMAEFIDGLSKSQAQAAKFSKDLSNQFTEARESITHIAEAVGIGFGVAEIKEFITNIIETNSRLDDLSKIAGVAADVVGGIGFAASKSGSNLEDAAAGISKLNRTIAEAGAGNAAPLDAFTKLGVAFTDAAGDARKADDVFADVATKFAGYADGPNKTALAIALFGKAGAALIPLLDEGGAKLQENVAYYQRYSGVTAETAEASNKFGSTMKDINLLSGAFGQTLVADLLPYMQKLAEAFLAVKENGDQFKSGADAIVEVLKGIALVADVGAEIFIGYAHALAGVTAAAVAFIAAPLGEKFAAAGAALGGLGDDATAAQKRVSGLYDMLYGPNKLKPDFSFNAAKDSSAVNPGSKLPDAPRLAPKSTGPVDDPAKKAYEGQLKAIQAFMDAQKSMYDAQDKYLSTEYDYGLTSLQAAFADQDAIRAKELATQESGYDAQIKASNDYLAKIAGVKGKDTERQNTLNKIAEIEAQRAKTEQSYSQDTQQRTLEEARAIQLLKEKYDDLRATVLTYEGDTAAAAQISIAAKVRQANELAKQATPEGQQTDFSVVARLQTQLKAQADIAESTKQQNLLTGQLGITEGRIQIARDSGNVTTLQQEAQLEEARKSTAAQLETIVQAQEAAAAASNNPELILQAQKARLALDQLTQSANILQKQFQDLFVNDSVSAFDEFVTGAKSAKDAFKDFANSVVKDISHIADQNIAESLFGKSGAGGSVPGFFAGLFGSGSSSAPSTNPAVPAYLGDTSSGAGGALSGVFGKIASVFGFAGGGTMGPNRLAPVGENGPELLDFNGKQFLMTGNQSANIIPNDKVQSGGRNISVVINPPPTMTRQSARQLAGSVSRSLSLAGRDS